MTINPLIPNFDLHGAFPFGSHDDAHGAPTFSTCTLAEHAFEYVGVSVQICPTDDCMVLIVHGR